MKTSLLLLALFFSFNCYAQTLELTMSTPQPRIGQKFTLAINADTLTTDFFGFLLSKFRISPSRDALNTQQSLSVDVWASKIGDNEIGPLKLNFNGKKYITNKITFKVIDSLPAIDKGFWIREVPINDTTFYVLIDQRIPAQAVVTHNGNSTNLSTETSDDEKEGQMVYGHAENVKFDFNQGTSEMQSISLPNSEKELKFKYAFWRYKLIIIDKTKPVVLTEDDFQDLPNYYRFKKIVVN